MLLWRLRLALPRLLAAIVLVAVAAGIVTHGLSSSGGACPSSAGATDRSNPPTSVPPGARALAIPTRNGAPAVQRGDRVELLAGGSVIAAGTVVRADPDGQMMTVAVPPGRAAAVAAALAAGDVIVALVG